jgi:hypothetical protein
LKLPQASQKCNLLLHNEENLGYEIEATKAGRQAGQSLKEEV